MDVRHSKLSLINLQELINGMLRSKSKRASYTLENEKDKATIHSRSIVLCIRMHVYRWKQHLNM
eukprot:13142345-Ditylum_brightwellii.AAC.1